MKNIASDTIPRDGAVRKLKKDDVIVISVRQEHKKNVEGEPYISTGYRKTCRVVANLPEDLSVLTKPHGFYGKGHMIMHKWERVVKINGYKLHPLPDETLEKQ